MMASPTIKRVVLLAVLASFALFLFGAKQEEGAAETKKAPVAAKIKKAEDVAPKGEEAAEDKDKEAKAEKPYLNDPAVKVGDVSVSVGALEQIFAQMSPMQLHDLKKPEKMDDFIDRVVKTELMAAEARRRGYDKDPEVVAIYKNKIASLMHRRISDAADKEEVSDEDLKKYYDAHYDDYHKPEKKRARHIQIADQAKAEKLLKDVISKKVKQQEFRKMAKENTEDETTKKQGGDLGFFTKVADRKEGDREVDPALVEAAFTLDVNGQVYQKIIKTANGYHILMLTGQRKKMDFSFEDSKDRLKVLVRREKRKETIENSIEKLKERFPVEINEENLKHVVIELSGKDPANTKKKPRK